ncbi:MAG: TetR/AcrR family transcriptional regulator [Oscillospiraceae bacterium]|nr:TetR/AcrR family transcriptional regulator [Oscillospiraceae bacterium]
MDRRQKKTREAIFQAFTKLLSEKNYHQITVQEIIDEADIGRTTFYAHFETKDYLLKDLCEELFGHIIDTAIGLPHEQHSHYSCGTATDPVFLHLLRHLQENDRNVLGLLSSDNNDIFLRYFKSNLKKLIITQYADKGRLKNSELPSDFIVNHISSSFVETVHWWVSHKMQETPEEITGYFLKTVETLVRIDDLND